MKSPKRFAAFGLSGLLLALPAAVSVLSSGTASGAESVPIPAAAPLPPPTSTLPRSGTASGAEFASATAITATPDSAPATEAEQSLRFNFRNAPLEQVLNYLSEAAGLVIVLDTSVHGSVTMWSAKPITKTEAIQLLNHSLNRNGYSAALQGKNLIISSKDSAKKQNIPVRTGNDPKEIPATAEMVMQVIPLRYIGTAQAARDIATLIPETATITANEDSNSLIVTDTNINVRHIVEIVTQIDGSIAADSSFRIFQLHNSDPVEMAGVITNLFGSSSSTSGNRSTAGTMPIMTPGGMISMRMGGSSTSSRGSSGRSTGGASSGPRAAVPVSAVPDQRTNSLIITASKDTLSQIGEIIAQLDSSGAKKQKVYVHTLENADVRQVETILKNLFQSSNNRSTTNTQGDALSNRAQSNSQQNSGSFLNNNNGR